MTMTAGTLPGYAFGVLAPHLVSEFGLSRLQLGLLLTTFYLVGGSLSLAAGRAVDHFGPKRVVLFSFALLSASVTAIAASPGYAFLLGSAAVSGVALAVANPATNKLVAIHIPEGRRGLIMGTKQAGAQFGAFLSGAVLAPLASISWRLAFAITALIPFGTVLATLFVVQSDARNQVVARVVSWRKVFARIRWLAAYAFLMGTATAAVVAYLPLYLVEKSDVTPTEAGVVVGLMGLVGIAGRVVWAWISERMLSYWIALFVIGMGGIVSVLIIIAINVWGFGLAYLAAIVLGATALTWNSVGMMAILSASERGTAGQASGIVLFGFYLGFVASPIVFGWIVDSSGTYLWGWMVMAVAFGCAAAIAALRSRLLASTGSPEF